MAQKATPINELPQQQQQGIQPQYQEPPQAPNFQEPIVPQNRGQQQPEYNERQFVPVQQQNPPQQYSQQPPQPFPQQPSQPFPQQYPQQPSQQPSQQSQQSDTVNKTSTSNRKGMIQDLVNNWKILLICAIVLFVAQQEPLQELVRKLFRVIKVPENILFYVSKLVISLIFVLIFFFTNRNL